MSQLGATRAPLPGHSALPPSSHLWPPRAPPGSTPAAATLPGQEGGLTPRPQPGPALSAHTSGSRSSTSHHQSRGAAARDKVPALPPESLDALKHKPGTSRKPEISLGSKSHAKPSGNASPEGQSRLRLVLCAGKTQHFTLPARGARSSPKPLSARRPSFTNQSQASAYCQSLIFNCCVSACAAVALQVGAAAPTQRSDPGEGVTGCYHRAAPS